MMGRDAQNTVRLALLQRGYMVFRVDGGEGWTGARAEAMPDGRVAITAPRRFSTGLPKGFPDLLVLGADGRAGFIEVRAGRGRVGAEQEAFIRRVRKMGFRAGAVRDEAEAIAMMEGETT